MAEKSFNLNKFKAIALIVIALGATVYLVQNCAAPQNELSRRDPSPGALTQTSPGEKTYVQIERLGRPAVNEGLVVSNELLTAYNSVPPTVDLTPAAAPVVAEAANTITKVNAAGSNDPQIVAKIAGAFLPDVMRIETSMAVGVGQPAYPSRASSTKGILLGGRKIEDDVIDITLSAILGASISDNVSYAGVQGNPGQPGHKLLHGQIARQGPATFPFLARPH